MTQRTTTRNALARLLLLAAALAATLGAPARAQAPLTAEDLILRDIRLRALLDAPAAPERLGAPWTYHQDGRAIRLYPIRPERGDVRAAREVALTLAPGLPAEVVAIDRVVVAFDIDIDRAGATGFLNRVGAVGLAVPIRGMNNVYVADTRTAADAFAIADALQGVDGVRYAHPDFWSGKHYAGRPANPSAADAISAVAGPSQRGELPPMIRVRQGLTPITSGQIFDFGTTVQGAFVPVEFTIFNDGDDPLVVEALDPIPAGYSLSAPPSTVIIVPGGSNSKFFVTLLATSQGTFSGDIVFLHNDPALGPTFILGVTGVVDPPIGPAQVRVSQDTNILSSGANVNVGTVFTNVQRNTNFAIANIGADDLLVGTVMNAPVGFTITSQPAGTVAGGMSTGFTIRLLSDTPGSFSGTINFLHNGINAPSPFQINISGTVEEAPMMPVLRVTRNNALIPHNGSDSFGATNRLEAVQLQYLLHNDGGENLTINSLVAPTGFSVVFPPALVIAPGQNSAMTLQLDAVCAGSYAGQFKIFSDDPNVSPYVFSLFGSVNEPAPTGGIDDADFGMQWHLANTGQGGGVPGIDVRAPSAWSITKGVGSIVAVLDDGTQPDHPDYRNNLFGEFMNIYDPALTFGGGAGSHGTAVAGLVAASANYCGGRGVAPEAGLFASNFFITDAEIAQTMYDVESMGANVHSNSWKYVYFLLPPVVRDAIQDLSANGRSGKGLPFLFASGNDFSPVPWGSAMASMEETIAIGAMSNRARRSVYSNFGPQLDVVSLSNGGTADTLGIFTTDVTGAGGYNPLPSIAGGDFTSGFSGTSAATPIASGVVALMLSANDDLYASQVRRILRHTAREEGFFGGIERRYGAITGFSDSYGYGLIDANAAVNAAVQAATNGGRTWPAPAHSLEILTRNDPGITIGWINPPTDSNGEYVKALLVRYTATITWRPTDGIDYTSFVGQLVSTGARILALDDIDTYTDPGLRFRDEATYVVYIVNGINRYSVPTIVAAPRHDFITVFFDDFEADLGWLTTNDWQRGVPNQTIATRKAIINGVIQEFDLPMPPTILGFNAPYSGIRVFATNLSGDYGPALTHTLTSPPINLTDPQITLASVTYMELLDIEGLTNDVARLEVIDFDTQVVTRTLLSNHQDLTYTWRPQWFDLRTQLGKVIQLRWTLIANDRQQYSGWHLDDVRVAVTLGADVPPPPRRPPIIIPGFEDIAIPPIGMMMGGAGGGVFQSTNDLADPDLNGDGLVNELDLAIFFDHYGTHENNKRFLPAADLDDDGRIGLGDLLWMLAHMASQGPS